MAWTTKLSVPGGTTRQGNIGYPNEMPLQDVLASVCYNRTPFQNDQQNLQQYIKFNPLITDLLFVHYHYNTYHFSSLDYHNELQAIQ